MYFFNSLFAAMLSLAMSAVLLLHGYAAVTHAFLASHFSSTQEVTQTPDSIYPATSSPSVLGAAYSIIAATSTEPKAASKTTSAPHATPTAKVLPPVNTAVPAPAPAPAPTLLPTEEVNTEVRQSLVNILCTTKSGGTDNTISGSGIIIDTRGVVLTNAHVGQYFLLNDYPTPGDVNCILRTGSPAQAAYTAELLYLPPQWIAANASQITAQEGTGTGENDYAFLLITGPAGPTLPSPSSFPALPMTLLEPSTGDQVLLAAYPAGFLGGATIQQNLYSSSAVSTIEDLYTFASSTVDLASLSGTVVAQSGSSGGAVVSLTSGKLLGLIATETTATTTADRTLHSITLAYIDRSLRAQGQGGLAAFLSQGLNQVASDFNANVAPSETAQLEAVLEKH